jgi:type II secretory pathway predicted ATPase ExeA
MYREYWGLRENPFSNTFDTRFFYLSQGFEDAVRRFFSTMSENRGIMLLLGETGGGKTYLSKLIAEQLRTRGIRVAQMITPRLTPDGFAREVGKKLAELRTPLDPNQKPSSRENPPPAALIIDEAQCIGEAETFDVLRALLDLDCRGHFTLTTLLSGGDEILNQLRTNPSLDQRIGVRYRLAPFHANETAAYIDFRLSAAGATSNIFEPEAKEDVHAITEGVPRLINTICDLSMVIAADKRMLRVNTEIITDARKAMSMLR